MNPHATQGVNRLHQALIGTAGLVAASIQQVWLEFGTIGADLSLSVDRYTVAFPPGSWYISELYTAPDPIESLVDPQSGTVALTRPTILHPFRAGDRVLVALLHGGADPVVLCRVATFGTVTM